MAEFALNRVVAIFVLILAAIIFVAAVRTALMEANKNANPEEFPGAGLFKKEYIVNVEYNINNALAEIKWEIKNRDDISTPRIYYVNGQNAFAPAELRETDYSEKSKDLKQNAEKNAAVALNSGVNRIEIAVFDKKDNKKLLQKKELYFMAYSQNYLDKFNINIDKVECSNYEKCNIIKCKTSDLTETIFTKKQQELSIGLTESQLSQLVKDLNSKCKFPISKETTYARKLEACSPEEIYKLFEDALTLKADEKRNNGDTRTFGAIRQEIYDKTFSKKCVDALRDVLNSNGWSEIK